MGMHVNSGLRILSRLMPVILFFIIFMFVQQIGSGILLLIYFLVAELALFFYWKNIKTVSITARRLFLIILFFWFQEFVSAQENTQLRYAVYALEVMLITYLFIYSSRHIKSVNRKSAKITTIALCAFLAFNFSGILITYGDPLIFLYSAYDSCKYFALIYYILAINIYKDEIRSLLELLAGVVIMHTFCAVMQFGGSELFFDIFRGRFEIVTRIGSLRAIGMFPYGIELGNYCCVLFALYYNFSNIDDKNNRTFYSIISLCLIICIVTSGTRTAMANVAFIYIVSNISNVKKWLKTLLVCLCVLIIGSNFIDIENIIARTKWDISVELPRTYYFTKGLEIWSDHPFFGIGYNTYGSLKYRDRTNDEIFNTYNAHAFDYASLATTDSFIAEVIPEYGILGILTIILYGREIYKVYRKKRDRGYYKIFVMVVISVSVMSINTSTAYINAHIGTWFWISCGCLLGCHRAEIKKIGGGDSIKRG